MLGNSELILSWSSQNDSTWHTNKSRLHWYACLRISDPFLMLFTEDITFVKIESSHHNRHFKYTLIYHRNNPNQIKKMILIDLNRNFFFVTLWFMDMFLYRMMCKWEWCKKQCLESLFSGKRWDHICEIPIKKTLEISF